MRRLVFDAHIYAGKIAGGLIVLWSLTGSLMILDPILRRGLDRAPKQAASARVDSATVSPAALRAASGPASAVRLRSDGTRTWLEVERPKGPLEAYDAATGRPTHALLPSEEALALLSKQLDGGKWRPVSAERIDAYDYDYKTGELPAFRARLDGPGGIVLYISARDGSWQKTTTVWARAFKRLGMGLHTWNYEFLRGPWDDTRRWALVILIGLPCTLLGALGLILLRLRSKAAAAPKAAARRAVAAGAAVSILLSCVPQASAQAMARAVSSRPIGASGVAVIAPGANFSALSFPTPAPSIGLIPPINIKTPSILPQQHAAVAVAVPIVLPASTIVQRFAISASNPRPEAVLPLSRQLETRLTAPLQDSSVAPQGDASGESFAATGRVLFDGSGNTTADGTPVPAAPSSGDGGNGLAPPGGGSDGSPRGPRRSGAFGLYVTHAAHMAVMSSVWRVAWPLFALDTIGKAGLAWVGSTAGLATMGGGLLAGVLIDRFLPRRSLVGSALVRAALAAGVAVAAFTASPGVAFFLAAATAHSFATMTVHIGQSALSPRVAGGDETKLQKINTTLKLISAAVSIPGALVGGWLAASVGVPGAFIAYAAVSLLILAPAYHFLLPEAAHAKDAPEEKKPKGGFLETARVILSSRPAMGAMAAMALLTLMNAPLQGTTLPILAREGLSGGAQAVGALLSAFSAGQFVGILAQLGLAKRLPPKAWVWLGAGGMAAFSFLTLTLPSFWPTAAAVALLAALTQPASVALKTIFQKEVAARRPELLGRAMGLNNLAYELAVVGGGALLALAVAGTLASAVSTLALVYAGLGLAVGAAAWWMGRKPRPKDGSGSKLHGFALGGLPLALGAGTPAAWHVLAGTAFGALILLYSITGTVSLMSPWLKSFFDPKLPAYPEVRVEAEQFPLSPAAAALALTPEEREQLKPGMPRLRAVPGSPRKRWYAFELADGSLIDVHARTGRRMRSPRSVAFVRSQVRRWLAGTSWKASGPPVLMTAQGDHYRKGETPHYRVDLDGPGGYQAFFSVKDGRLLETHSRLSRFLRLTGKGPHTWAIKSLDRYDILKRLLAPVLLGLPMLAIAGTAFWLKARHGFSIEIPNLGSDLGVWHRFLGTYSLFALALMSVTGPLTLLMPVVTKKLTPKLPHPKVLGPETFTVSPLEASARLGADARPVTVSLRATSRRAWYEFELSDGTRRAISAQDGGEAPVLLTPEEIGTETRDWLEGSPWSVKGAPVLLESYDAHYKNFQEAELPVYRVELDGPKGLRLYLSARDGRPVNLMSVRTRLSRWLAVGVKAVHAFEWGPFGRYETLRRLTMILLLTLPLAATVILGFMARF